MTLWQLQLNILTDEERKQLERNIRSGKTPVRIQERSRIVLLASECCLNQEIAKELGISQNKVVRWRNRYAAQRHAGNEKDLPRRDNHGLCGQNQQKRFWRK